MKNPPNWLEMPDELMANILQRLGTVDKLRIARTVCGTWRRICKDPAMWKIVYIDKFHDGCDTDYNLEMLVKQAVDLSCGELIDISIVGFCDDYLLDYIVLRSSKLKSFSIWDCYDVSGWGVSQAVKRVPQLEKLHLTDTCTIPEEIEVIGRNCPQLKSFETDIREPFMECDDQAVAIAKNMPELRHLRIYGLIMTNHGVRAILNGCPHLQSLNIHMFYSFELDRNLVKVCMERIKNFEHNATENDDDLDDIYSFGSDVDDSFEEDD
ncbi:hypothetical protein L2E82_39758 [Cichorium intybus]|uniref:Uncharacterized protein n=1 Tax=Cichorium intybus TaxID=13427 RepID=A0ACB9AJ56_CICIN|nr:hypothetical protein L2E82_39758 [Cichorium intybus]